MPNESKPSNLKVALKTRHVSMLALGSALGAGLFVGSSTVIASTGPGAFITYALTGVIVALVMRMLGEMAAAHPSTGSFIEYARLAFGRPAGYMTGWLYWYFWVIVVGFEAVAGAQIINVWLPDIPVWTIALGLMMSMTMLNLMSVHSFGEAEYWFAGVKVVAILVFVGVVVFFMLDNDSTATANFGNLTAHGGFLPYGVGSLFAGVVVVIFSMTGMEVATLAAAESEDPARSIRKVANTVIMRIMIFLCPGGIPYRCSAALEQHYSWQVSLRDHARTYWHSCCRHPPNRGNSGGGALCIECRYLHCIAGLVHPGIQR